MKSKGTTFIQSGPSYPGGGGYPSPGGYGGYPQPGNSEDSTKKAAIIAAVFIGALVLLGGAGIALFIHSGKLDPSALKPGMKVYRRPDIPEEVKQRLSDLGVELGWEENERYEYVIEDPAVDTDETGYCILTNRRIMQRGKDGIRDIPWYEVDDFKVIQNIRSNVLVRSERGQALTCSVPNNEDGYRVINEIANLGQSFIDYRPMDQ